MSTRKRQSNAGLKAETSIVETTLKNEVRDAAIEFSSFEFKDKRARQISNYLDNILTEEEWLRFEFYIRSHLTRNRVKDVMKECLPVKDVDDEMAIIVGGLTKLFIGELCDNAVDVMEEAEEKGSMRPNHIREAYRRLQRDGKIGLRPDVFNPFMSLPQTRVVSMDDLLNGK